MRAGSVNVLLPVCCLEHVDWRSSERDWCSPWHYLLSLVESGRKSVRYNV